MWFPIYPQGTRVRVRRGGQPIDASMLGRAGLVVHTDLRWPGRYGVILDGEDGVRTFRENELEKEPAAETPAAAEDAPAPETAGAADET